MGFFGREVPLFHKNLDWWNMIIWPQWMIEMDGGGWGCKKEGKHSSKTPSPEFMVVSRQPPLDSQSTKHLLRCLAHSRVVAFEVATKGNGQKIHHKGRRCFLLVGCLRDFQAMLDYREGWIYQAIWVRWHCPTSKGAIMSTGKRWHCSTYWSLSTDLCWICRCLCWDEED